MKVFNDPTSSPDSVSSVDELLLVTLYGAPKTTKCLNVHRHRRFMKAVPICPVQSKIQLAALPPTSAAAKEHSLSVYHQVQMWLEVELPPTEWGLKLIDGQLQPVLHCRQLFQITLLPFSNKSISGILMYTRINLRKGHFSHKYEL